MGNFHYSLLFLPFDKGRCETTLHLYIQNIIVSTFATCAVLWHKFEPHSAYLEIDFPLLSAKGDLIVRFLFNRRPQKTY